MDIGGDKWLFLDALQFSETIANESVSDGEEDVAEKRKENKWENKSSEFKKSSFEEEV